MKKERIIIIGGVFPKESEAIIYKLSKKPIQSAANALQWSYIDGLIYNNQNITLFNLPFISSYPAGYSKLFIRKGVFSSSRNIYGINVSFNNLTGYKLFSRYINLKKSLLKWFRVNNSKTTIIIYSVHIPFILAAARIKKKYPKTKIILIVPDLPEYMSNRNDIVYKLYRKITKRIYDYVYPKIDSFVLLSPYMNNIINPANKPYKVIEGIYNQKDEECLETNRELIKHDLKVILYTGTLCARYGILNLIEAFNKLNDSRLELHICGDGDAKSDVLNYCKNNRKIKYLGQLSRDKIIKMQREAFLLVNPRLPNEIFTKYSFPSKTMEYLASGTPSLIYKLEGIPQEYFSYCFYPKDNNIESLTEKIKEILSFREKDLFVFGNKARDFIINHKNPKIQTEKLVDLINYNLNIK